jgi:hypothetical protein
MAQVTFAGRYLLLFVIVLVFGAYAEFLFSYRRVSDEYRLYYITRDTLALGGPGSLNYRPGDRIDLSTDSAYLGRGWSTSRPTGRHIEAPGAQLFVKLAGRAEETGCVRFFGSQRDRQSPAPETPLLQRDVQLRPQGSVMRIDLRCCDRGNCLACRTEISSLELDWGACHE